VLGAEHLRAECSNTVLHHRPGNRYVQGVVQLELYIQRIVYFKTNTNLFVYFTYTGNCF
jgi:hypothetical protein